MRLSLLVVFSAAAAFLIGSDTPVDWQRFAWLVLGGFLVTGSANAFNQVIEKDLDKMMERTQSRPLPGLRMKPLVAVLVAMVMGLTGLFILFYFLNFAAGILGLLALAGYTLMYTPLKRITPFAVFVGAFPGAIPVLLGYVSAAGQFDLTAMVLFSIQFFWQFPHFWAIAWVMDEDYKKAGFALLPSAGGRTQSSAFYALIYTCCLLPIGIMPFLFHVSGVTSLIIILLSSLLFTYLSWRLFRKCDMISARRLMFGSFFYLPVVLLAITFDRL